MGWRSCTASVLWGTYHDLRAACTDSELRSTSPAVLCTCQLRSTSPTVLCTSPDHPGASAADLRAAGGPSADVRAAGPSADLRAGGPSPDLRAAGPSAAGGAAGPSPDLRGTSPVLRSA